VKILDLGRAPRQVQRLTEIAAVLVRHGLSYFVSRLNLSRYLPRREQFMASGSEEALDRESVAARLTRAMEDLGPTFVRLGQLLASRPDLLDEEFIHEFQRLQDRVAPFPSEEARAIVEAELGRPVGELFARFEDEPAASGSLAQVHRATLPDGTEVVVKVKRPGIDRLVLTDLSLLRPLAAYAERQVPELQMVQPVALLEELERTIRRELDFVTEASNTARFHRELAEVPGAVCPRVFWDLTSSGVLTMERLDGARITDLDAIGKIGANRGELARRLADIFLKQYLDMGVFHGDPHPGNLLILRNGAIGIIDFGMVGRLTTELQNKLGALLVALVGREVDIVAELCFSLGMMGEEFNETAFKVGVVELLDKYYGMPLKRIDPGRVFSDVTSLARDTRLVLPRDFVLLAKSLVTIVSTARLLDPDFNLSEILRPRAQAVLRRRLAPRELAKSVGLNLWGFGTLVQALPRSFLRILRRAESGKLQVTFRHAGYEKFVSELDRAANRITVSLILASFVVGSSLLLTAKAGGLGYDSRSILGVLGYAVAAILGIWTVWGILRSGRL